MMDVDILLRGNSKPCDSKDEGTEYALPMWKTSRHSQSERCAINRRVQGYSSPPSHTA